MKKLLLLIGVLLGSLMFVGSASAAQVDQSYQPRCTAPCTQTFHFVPDPGQTYDLSWDADYHYSFQETYRSTCSGDENQPGCTYTVTYTNPGDVQMVVAVSGQVFDGADFAVDRPQDGPAPVDVQAPDPLVVGREHLTVYTPKSALNVDWSSDQRFPSGVPVQGSGQVRRIGRASGGRNQFAVTIDAPKGQVKVHFYAYNPDAPSGVMGDTGFIQRQVIGGGSPSSRGSATIRQQQSVRQYVATLVARGRPVRKAHLTLQALRHGAWRTVASSSTVRLVVRGPRWKHIRAELHRGLKYRIIARYAPGAHRHPVVARAALSTS